MLVVYTEYNSAGIKFILIGNNDSLNLLTSVWDKYLRTEVSLGNNLRKTQKGSVKGTIGCINKKAIGDLWKAFLAFDSMERQNGVFNYESYQVIS